MDDCLYSHLSQDVPGGQYDNQPAPDRHPQDVLSGFLVKVRHASAVHVAGTWAGHVQRVGGEEDQEQAVHEQLGVVDVATERAPLVLQQERDQRVAQQVLPLAVHLQAEEEMALVARSHLGRHAPINAPLLAQTAL